MSIEPNPFDDERLIQIRKTQKDPISQYYIVRTDISMSVGKICAQVAHAAQMFALEFASRNLSNSLGSKKDLVEQWMNGSFRKIVLGGTAKDFEKIKNILDVFVVRDAGLTEVECGTETVMVSWPMLKSLRPKELKRLQVLK